MEMKQGHNLNKLKYYCEDIGLWNARIGFRQQEMTHIMENIIFNELMVWECAVDIVLSGSSGWQTGAGIPWYQPLPRFTPPAPAFPGSSHTTWPLYAGSPRRLGR